MDLPDADGRARFPVRDRDAQCTQAYDAVLADAGLEGVTSGIRMPQRNSSCSAGYRPAAELLDCTLSWNQSRLLHALRGFESFCNGHRPPPAMGQAAPLRPLPEPATAPGRTAHLEVHRQDRLGGTPHEDQQAA
ncbi:integrase [Streptomyces sp. NPDC050388]|uniref:integrase n=1 Tax=Streptomyces sp. NPDC050388 TaxID=3155781 RepID=UPI00344A2494